MRSPESGVACRCCICNEKYSFQDTPLRTRATNLGHREINISNNPADLWPAGHWNHQHPRSRSRAALIDYGIRTVIDLRRTHEVEEAPNVFAGSSQVTYHHQNMIGDEPLAGTADSVETGEAAERIPAIYGSWLDLCQPEIRRTLATLAEPGARPAMYHCAGGKDRTGIISALLLGIAGVPEDIIAEDYALSAQYLLNRYFANRPESNPGNYTMEDFQREYCPPDTMLTVLEHL
ncbi:MAG: tyrosine-protein phosphatase, partial [Proteobacteria bacterium]|nr:tyrosine-protein phosphatase [Pseudomonadota bacterium]